MLNEAGSEVLSLQLGVVPSRATKNVRVLIGSSDPKNFVCGPGPECTLLKKTAEASSVNYNFGRESTMTTTTGEDGSTSTTIESTSTGSSE